EQREQRCRHEEAHSVPVVVESKRIELDAREQNECRAQVPRQVMEAEQTVGADVCIDPIRVQVGMPEIEGIAEAQLVHPRERDGDRRRGCGEQDEAFEDPFAPLRIPEGLAQISAAETAAVAERLEQEEDGGEENRSAGEGAARECRSGPNWMLRAKRCVQVEQSQRDADDFRGEPDLATDRAGPGEGPEAEQQCEDGMVPFGSRAAFELLDAAQEEI